MKKQNTKTPKQLGILSGENFDLKKHNREKRRVREAREQAKR